VKLFAEKVVLAATVPVLLILWANPMRFDWHQRISASLAVLFFAYFIAHTLEKSKNSGPHVPPPTATTSTPQAKSPTSLPEKKTAAPVSSLPKQETRVLKRESKPEATPPQADRSIKIGEGAQITNSPMTTGDNSPLTINQTPISPPARTLSQEKFNRLVNELAGDAAVDITLVPADDETGTFGNQIVTAFKNAGWSVSTAITGTLSITVVSEKGATSFNGDGFTCSANENVPELAKALRAFAAIDLKCAVRHDLTGRAPLSIYIGKRK
jgi:hypothetical protein